MRFAFIFDGLDCGGIERVGVEYCNSLVERGHEVTVINLAPTRDAFVAKLSNKVQYITRTFPRKLAPERYCSLVSRVSWGRYAYPFAYLVSSAIVALKKPFLCSGIGVFDVSVAFSGHFNDLTFAAYGCVNAKTKLAWIHGTINGYTLISDGYVNLYKRFDKLVCLSDEGIEEFLDAKHWLNLPIVKMYNPVDLSSHRDNDVKKNELQAAYGDFILMVSRLASPKDPETLIDAISILRDRYGIEKNCLIVGDGPDMERVSKSISASTVADLVHLIGYEENPAPYYQACEVFVLSSLNEGLPTVLLEAMAWSKPVVSTNVLGAREILEGGKDGILCRIRDPEDMAEKIAALLRSNAMKQHYVNNATERIKDFSREKVVDTLLNLVETLAGVVSEVDEAHQ